MPQQQGRGDIITEWTLFTHSKNDLPTLGSNGFVPKKGGCRFERVKAVGSECMKRKHGARWSVPLGGILTETSDAIVALYPPPRLAGSVAKRSAFNHFWDRLLMCTPVSRTDGIEMEWFVPTTVRTVCVLSSH